MDLIKNLIDSGANFTQLTRERAESMVNELVREGQVRTEEFQANVQDLLDRSRSNAERFNDLVRQQVISVLKDLGISAGAAKKAPAKKTAAKKAPAKKAPAKKAAGEEGAGQEGRGEEGSGQEGAGQEGARPRRRRRRRRPRRPPARSALAGRRRLDAELVRRGLVASRADAQAAVTAGRVTVGGAPAWKPARLVAPDEPLASAGSGAALREPRRRQARRRPRAVRGRRGRPARPRRRRLDRRVHRLPAAAGRGAGGGRRRRPRPAPRAASGRPPGRRPGADQRAHAAPRTTSAGRSTSWWPISRSSRSARCCPPCSPAPGRAPISCSW